MPTHRPVHRRRAHAAPSWPARARKFLTAVVGLALTWGTLVVTSDAQAITGAEWLTLAGMVATAAGVYQVTNAPPGTP